MTLNNALWSLEYFSLGNTFRKPPRAHRSHRQKKTKHTPTVLEWLEAAGDSGRPLWGFSWWRGGPTAPCFIGFLTRPVESSHADFPERVWKAARSVALFLLATWAPVTRMSFNLDGPPGLSAKRHKPDTKAKFCMIPLMPSPWTSQIHRSRLQNNAQGTCKENTKPRQNIGRPYIRIFVKEISGDEFRATNSSPELPTSQRERGNKMSLKSSHGVREK